MTVKFTNNASGTLASSITSSSTTITLTTGQGALFPSLTASDWFYATLTDSSNNIEIVKVTGRSTDVLTVVRGQDNTTARGYTGGDKFELRPTAASLTDITAFTPSGNIAATTMAAAIVELDTEKAGLALNNTYSGTNTFGGTVALNGTTTTSTQTAGDNTTKVATTAFVTSAVSTATGALGTMSTQNSSSVNITGGTMSGMTSIADTLGAVRSVPTQSKSTAYVLQASDNGQCVYISTGGVTIPAGVFSAGAVVTIYNNSATAQTITQGASATVTLAAVGTTGNRTLGAYGLCTVLCLTTNTFVISGAGIY